MWRVTWISNKYEQLEATVDDDMCQNKKCKECMMPLELFFNKEFLNPKEKCLLDSAVMTITHVVLSVGEKM